MLSQLEQLAVAERLGQLDRASDRVWAVALTTGLVCTLIAAYGFPYPVSASGKFWAYAGLLVRASLYLWAGESLAGRGGETLARLFRMGLVAGAFELLVDWWLIHGVSSGRLIYMTGNDVTLLGSPIWMPLAWEIVAVQFGYIGVRLFEWRPVWGLLLAGLLGAINIPFYEEMARQVKWWKYSNCQMFLHTPYYIILGEFGIVLMLAILARLVRTKNYRWAILAGVVGGLGIWGCYAGAFWVIEKLW